MYFYVFLVLYIFICYRDVFLVPVLLFTFLLLILMWIWFPWTFTRNLMSDCFSNLTELPLWCCVCVCVLLKSLLGSFLGFFWLWSLPQPALPWVRLSVEPAPSGFSCLWPLSWDGALEWLLWEFTGAPFLQPQKRAVLVLSCTHQWILDVSMLCALRLRSPHGHRYDIQVLRLLVIHWENFSIWLFVNVSLGLWTCSLVPSVFCGGSAADSTVLPENQHSVFVVSCVGWRQEVRPYLYLKRFTNYV